MSGYGVYNRGLELAQVNIIIPLGSIIFFISILFFMRKPFRKNNSCQKIKKPFLVAYLIVITVFSFFDIPKIFHCFSKKSITIQAKVLDTQEYDSFWRKNGTVFYGCKIETNNIKLNHKELKDIKSTAYYYLEKNDLIEISGTISNYMFEVDDIKFKDYNKDNYYNNWYGDY